MPNRRSQLAMARIQTTILDDSDIETELPNDEIPESPFTSPSMPTLDESLSSFAFKMDM